MRNTRVCGLRKPELVLLVETKLMLNTQICGQRKAELVLYYSQKPTDAQHINLRSTRTGTSTIRRNQLLPNR